MEPRCIPDAWYMLKKIRRRTEGASGKGEDGDRPGYPVLFQKKKNYGEQHGATRMNKDKTRNITVVLKT